MALPGSAKPAPPPPVPQTLVGNLLYTRTITKRQSTVTIVSTDTCRLSDVRIALLPSPDDDPDPRFFYTSMAGNGVCDIAEHIDRIVDDGQGGTCHQNISGTLHGAGPVSNGGNTFFLLFDWNGQSGKRSISGIEVHSRIDGGTHTEVDCSGHTYEVQVGPLAYPPVYQMDCSVLKKKHGRKVSVVVGGANTTNPDADTTVHEEVTGTFNSQ